MPAFSRARYTCAMSAGPDTRPETGLTLDTYLDARERAEGQPGRTPFFVGRQTELHWFEVAMDAVRSGGRGQTIVFQGAPGSGKTALMKECEHRIVQRNLTDQKDPGTWGIVRASWADLNNPPDLFERIVQSISEAVGRTDRNLQERSHKFSLNLPEGFGFGYETSKRYARKPDSSLEELLTGLTADLEQSNPDGFDIQVCVLIDEIQNVEQTTTIKETLDSLHHGNHRFPILLAGFGLSNSQTVLESLGLSRLEDLGLFDLEPVSAEQAEQFVRLAFDRFGVGGSNANRWIQDIARDSQGWPQHMKSALTTALGALKEADLDSDQAVYPSDQIQENRFRYYRRRLANVEEWAPIYACLAARSSDGSVTKLELRNLFGIYQKHIGSESTNEDFDEFFERSLRYGLISRTDDLIYRIPIPSFSRYLVEKILPVFWNSEDGWVGSGSGPLELPAPTGPGSVGISESVAVVRSELPDPY